MQNKNQHECLLGPIELDWVSNITSLNVLKAKAKENLSTIKPKLSNLNPKINDLA